MNTGFYSPCPAHQPIDPGFTIDAYGNRKAFEEGVRIGKIQATKVCIALIKDYRFSDWSGEQEIYDQVEEIIARIEALLAESSK